MFLCKIYFFIFTFFKRFFFFLLVLRPKTAVDPAESVRMGGGRALVYDFQCILYQVCLVVQCTAVVERDKKDTFMNKLINQLKNHYSTFTLT